MVFVCVFYGKQTEVKMYGEITSGTQEEDLHDAIEVRKCKDDVSIIDTPSGIFAAYRFTDFKNRQIWWKVIDEYIWFHPDNVTVIE